MQNIAESETVVIDKIVLSTKATIGRRKLDINIRKI